MSELKILETKHFTVTTERIVHGSTVVPIREILRAWPMIERPWIFSVILGLAGLVCLGVGSLGVKLIGLLLMASTYGVHRILTSRTLVLAARAQGADSVIFDVPNGDELSQVMSAINQVIDDRKNAADLRLQRELAEMESSR